MGSYLLGRITTEYLLALEAQEEARGRVERTAELDAERIAQEAIERARRRWDIGE